MSSESLFGRLFGIKATTPHSTSAMNSKAYWDEAQPADFVEAQLRELREQEATGNTATSTTTTTTPRLRSDTVSTEASNANKLDRINTAGSVETTATSSPILAKTNSARDAAIDSATPGSATSASPRWAWPDQKPQRKQTFSTPLAAWSAK